MMIRSVFLLLWTLHLGGAQTNVRLYNGGNQNVPGMGYVEVFQNGAWGFVCEENWSQESAIVVCRELGYNTSNFIPLTAVKMNQIRYPSPRNITIASTYCNGSEASLLDCQNIAGVGHCTQQQSPIGGVQCRDLPQQYTVDRELSPTLECEKNSMIVTFKASNIEVRLLKTPPSSCPWSKSTGVNVTTVSFTTGKECGTELQENATHIIYNNTLEYTWTNNNSQYYSAYSNHRYQAICSMLKVNSVNDKYEPFTQAPRVSLMWDELGSALRIDLYANNQYKETFPTSAAGVASVEVGKDIYVLLTLNTGDTRLKLVINKCIATAMLPVAPQTAYVTLIDEKCPVFSNVTIYPISNNKQAFAFSAIALANYAITFIQCEVTICLANNTEEKCSRLCTGNPSNIGGRRRRQTGDDNIVNANADSDKIIVYKEDFKEVVDFLNELKTATTSGNEAPGDAGATLVAHPLPYILAFIALLSVTTL